MGGEEIFAETFVKKIHWSTVEIFGATSTALNKSEVMKLLLFSV